jgi:hypothetical protein
VSLDVPVSCPCPGSPHPDGDTIRLREKLGLAAGIAIQRMIIDANSEKDNTAELTGKLAEGYLLHGVESWTLVNEAGLDIPVNEATIRHHLLDDFVVASPVADAADGLYMAAVILPLVQKAQSLSPSTPTNGSTSPRPSGTPKPPKQRKRSSTTTTPTDSTEEISPELVGVSKS